MRWIKYQIVQSENDEGFVLVDKKIGYSEENLAIAESEAYGDVTIVNDSKVVVSNKVLDKTGFASGMHTEAGWRSMTSGYMTKADNTSFAAGRLAEAIGKCSFAVGIETYVDTSVVTERDLSIDDVKVSVSSNISSELNVGDYIAIKHEGYATSDCKRIVEIQVPNIPGWGDYYIILDSPLRAENYYEGYNAPGDGIIPVGALIKKAEITKATGAGAHAQGAATKATGAYSHAEGYKTEASGICSHTEGSQTKANGEYAHAEGLSTLASSKAQHVQGKYNVEDKDGKYAHVVGNGTALSKRSNCHTVDWDGNAWYSGSISAAKGIVVPYGHSLDEAPMDVPDGTLFVLITE